jgi:hypothetical protein
MDQRMRSLGAAVGNGAIFGCLVLALSGCGGSLTPDQRVEAGLKALHQSKLQVFPFAGKVMVDGLPAPSKTVHQRILVVLFDRAKHDLQVTDRPCAACNEKGEFSFTKYIPHDGVEPGEYVVAIAQLFKGRREGRFSGPDGFQNLNNDPDKNELEPMFVIKHASPGKKDYVFDLRVAGREPVSDPGSRAVTRIR